MAGRYRRPFAAHDDDDSGGTDGDDNDLPLDEQEQEQLIEDLRRENDRKNSFFILAFTCLCVIPAIIHMTKLLAGTGSGVDVLAVSSLAMTAFTVRAIPWDTAAQEYLSPMEAWVPVLNPALIAIITIGAFLSNRHIEHDYSLYMPLFVWILVNLGRRAMASVDIGQLEKLKYKYKGA